MMMIMKDLHILILQFLNSHLDIKPDVLHLHDWQTAMIAMLYKERYCYYEHYDNIKIVFTIHNIAFQGKADPKLLSELFGLDNYLYYNGNCRNDESSYFL